MADLLRREGRSRASSEVESKEGEKVQLSSAQSSNRVSREVEGEERTLT